jgi:hypothetical protein
MTSLNTVRLSEIREVWESFTGWHWFVTEYHEGSLAFGLVRGWELEWGYFDLDELRELENESRVWKVPKKNWAFCPCVESDAVSCSRETGAVKCRKKTVRAVPTRLRIERRWLENGR